MSVLKRQDLFSDDLIQAPLILADNMQRVVDTAKHIVEQMQVLNQQSKSAKSISEVADATKSLTDAEKELQNIQAQIQKAQARLSDEYVRQADELARVKEEQKRMTDEAKLNRQIAEQQEGSIKKLELQLKKNRLEYERMSKEQRENTEEGRQLLKIIQEQDKEYKELKQSIGQAQANVGNYKQAILDALGPLGGFTGGLGNLGSGLGNATKGIGLFSAGLKSIPIFAIISAITSLVSYFTKTEDGAMKLKVITSALATVFDTLVDYLIAAGRALSNLTLDNVKQGFQDLGNSIRDFVLSRIEMLLSGLKGIGTAFQLLFKGEFKQAAKEAGTAFLNIARSTTPIGIAVDLTVSAVKELGEVAKDVYNDISDRVQRSIQVAKDENALLLRKRQFLIDEAKLNREINENRTEASDQTKTDEERLQALLKAEAAVNALFDKRIALKREENRLAQIRDDLAENDIAANDAAAQREAELIQLEADRAAQQKELQSQISGLRKKIAEEERKEEIARIKAVNETALRELQDRVDKEVELIQQAAIRGEISKAEAQKRINEVIKRNADDLITSQIEGLQKLLEFDKLTADERADIEKQLAELKKKYNQAVFDQIEEQTEETKFNLIDFLEKTKETVEQFVGAFVELFLSASNRRIAALDAEIAKIDENAKRELLLAGDNEEAKRIIEQRAEERRQKLEEKRKKERQQQARLEKIAAIINATINTALAVTKALATSIPYALAVAALGAAQIATIVRQPIPQFFEGTKSAPGGLAIVGEKGIELVRERSGKTWLTPASATLMNIPRGAEVIPNDETMAMLATINRPLDYYPGNNLESTILKANRELISAIFATKPDLTKHGSILYEVITSANGNRQLKRKSLFG
ncbi:MAG: hypothetical protein KatS3mg031_2937 [Chitinophagales bacterium]|nr:MAG: hypothetical protein KatS3mg031_2937 [Chitinophagales bacterium]